MNDDLNVEPIHDKRMSDVKNINNADESFYHDINALNLNPRVSYEKKSTPTKNNNHNDDHFTEMEEEFEH